MNTSNDIPDQENEEDMDPSVPTDLLELHVQLEADKVSPEEFKEVYGK